MISDRYNYLTPFLQNTKGHHNENTTSRKPVSFPNGYPKTNHQDIYAKTYNDKNSKPEQKHRLGTVRKKFTGGGGGGGLL